MFKKLAVKTRDSVTPNAATSSEQRKQTSAKVLLKALHE